MSLQSKNERFTRTFLFKNADDFLSAVSDGRACNGQTHLALMHVLEPGQETRCPTCRKPIFAAPRYKSIHGGIILGCPFCAPTMTSFDKLDAVRQLNRETMERDI